MGLHASRPGARPLAPSSPGRQHARWRKGPLAGLLAGGLVVTAAFVTPPAARALEEPGHPDASPAPGVSREAAPHPRENTLHKRRWGVELRGVRLSAAGHMLEFRYKVLDAEKAEPLFERKTKPHLVHEASGATLTVPVPAKVGPLRNSDPPVEGRVYWMFFANPGQLVKSGEKVSVVIGPFRAERMVVE